MFERYSEKARRAIFFARYEASQFGGSSIEPEHLLLGLLREDKSLRSFFLQPGEGETIRKEIKEHKPFGKFVPTSVELPLAAECKRILAFAVEEASNLKHGHVEMGHLYLGILREENCFAARLLQARGMEIQEIRRRIAEEMGLSKEERPKGSPHDTGVVIRIDVREAIATVLKVWRTGDAEKISNRFHENGQLWDVQRKLWLGRKEIAKGLELYFSSREGDLGEENMGDVRFAQQNLASVTIVWEPRPGSENTRWGNLRMTLVLSETVNGWHVLSAGLEEVPSSSSL